MRITSRLSRLSAIAALVGLSSGVLAAQVSRSPVADAAMAKDAARVRQLLKSGADAGASQGDGMTALHWAAMQGDGAMAEMLLVAGANPRATTRIGGFTALHLASQAGRAEAVPALIKAGAPVDAATATGATALMLAAAAGNADIVAALAAAGADLNRIETAHGQTALMFAASLGRTDAAKVLLARGADASIRSRVVDLSTVEVPEEVLQDQLRQQSSTPQAQAARNEGAAAPARPAAPAPQSNRVAGVSRPYKYNELIGKHGGLTALHFAARQGAVETARALVEAGADVNGQTAGDLTSPMLIAMVNGHFDLALYFLEKGANPNLASDAGMTPLYAALNVHWAPKAFYPQPRAYLQQQASYLDVMKALIAKGADPNARLQRKIWYTQYNFDLLRVDDSGATPFWRAAYASDIDAMKLLVAAGADPSVPTAKPAMNDRFQQGGVRSADASRDAPDGGPGHSAAARRLRRRLRRRVCRQRAPLRAVGHARGGEVPHRRSWHRPQRAGCRRQHCPAPCRLARRQRDDQVPRLEGRRRDPREPRRPDYGGHGQRPGAARAAVSRDHQAAREPRREEQSQVRVVLAAFAR